MLTTRDQRSARRWYWVTPAVALFIGALYFVSGWLGGDLDFAILGLAVMATLAIVALLASRYSETVAGLMTRRDERINAMDARATNIAGLVVIGAIIVGFVTEIAQGQDGMPYSMLGALGGVAYVIALIVLRLRN